LSGSLQLQQWPERLPAVDLVHRFPDARAKAEAMIIDHDGNEFDSTIELPSAVVTSALKSLDIPQL